MRIIIIAVAGILLLGGAGAGAWFFFMKPAEASVGDTAEHKEAKKDDHKKAEGGHGAPAAQYVELDPLILPIVDKTGVTQTLSLVVMIEVGTPEAAAKVEELAPRLNDAYIQGMYGTLNKHEALQGGVVQVGMLKEKLNGISHKVLGEGVVNDVLLQVVQQRGI